MIPFGVISSAKQPPAPSDTFQITVKTDNPGTTNDSTFRFFRDNLSTSGYTVYWGDGTSDTFTSSAHFREHTYNSPGTYTISFEGDVGRLFFGGSGRDADPKKVLSVERWGAIAWLQMDEMFSGCTNLVVNASDAPDLSGVTFNGLMDTFRDCSSLTTEDLSSWDVSNIDTFEQTFKGCHSFNGNVSTWDTSSATTMRYMFGRFSGEPDMAFAGDVSGFNIANVTDLEGMFRGCVNFNADISGWTTTSVTTTENMLRDCMTFNRDISGWDMSSNTKARRMFFGATSFAQDLSSWNTGNIANMDLMFGSTAIDFDMGGWDVTSLMSATSMMAGVTLSTANYDSLLIGWEGQVVNNGVSFDAGNSTYTAGGAAETARTNLINDHSWSISDGGSV